MTTPQSDQADPSRHPSERPDASGSAEPTTPHPTGATGATGEGETAVMPSRHRREWEESAYTPADEGRQAPAEPYPGSYWQGSGQDRRSAEPTGPAPAEPAIFPEGVYAEPPSRAGAHLWALLLCLLLSPVAWFLLNDGTARVYWSLESDVSAINLAGVAGLAAGLLVATIVLLTGRWSSVGLAVAGVLSLLVGLAFVVVPQRAFEVLGRGEEPLRQFGGFGENLYAYARESALEAQFLLAGAVLVLVAVVSHGARRKGRREEYARLAVRAARGEHPFT